MDWHKRARLAFMEVGAEFGFVIDSPAPLLDALRFDGWRIIGPKAGDGAIVFQEIELGEDFPPGFSDEQEGGHYRLVEGNSGRWFDYMIGPHTRKKFLFPAHQKLWSAKRTDDGFSVKPHEDEWPKTVIFGARACEIAAIEVQDRVCDNGDFADSSYVRPTVSAWPRPWRRHGRSVRCRKA
ncbi:hypothetical protein [Oricola thermophila]|uniref:hypothetical protein n=1 Tax=Oricola thermophila TaxID=2742145 RepID=UPI0018D7DE95|nr:hypothetical protein [Oricola thermophila]